MSFLDTLGKGLGIVSPILSLIGGASSQRKANNSTNALESQIKNNNAFVDSYWAPLWDSTNSLRQDMSTTGPITDTYGLINSAQSLDPYGMNNANAQTAGYQEFTNDQYNKGAANISNDLEQRGIDPSSSGAISAFGNLRSDEAANIAGYRRNAAVANQQDAYNRVLQAKQLTNSLQEQNFGNSNNLLQMLASLRSQGTAGLGGLQQMYQSKSDAFGNDLGNLANVLAQAGALGRTQPTDPNRGDGRFGTNQAGSDSYSVPTPWGTIGTTRPMQTPQSLPIRFTYQ